MSRIEGSHHSATDTLKRLFATSPTLRRAMLVVLLLAVMAAGGRVVVPIAVQLTLDTGIRSDEGPRTGFVLGAVAICAVAVLGTAWVTYRMNHRLYREVETALAEMRKKAFRRVHDLSAPALGGEQRGDLVARVTSDVDQFSIFLQFGGMLLVSGCQLLVGSAVMFGYSWALALTVWAVFLPLALILPRLQNQLSFRYADVRTRAGAMLATTGEAVAGTAVIRAHNASGLIGRRIDTAVEEHRKAQGRAQRLVAVTLSSGEIAAALAIGAVVSFGVVLGVNGHMTAGELVAFLFLVTLFIGPAQMSTEVLNELQNALAGLRRTLAVIEAPREVEDPGERGVELAPGPVGVGFEEVEYAYPDGARVLHGVSVAIAPRSRVAVVGETGSGKSTFVKLLTRLADPTSGRVLLGGVPLTDVPLASLRRRVVMVPQDGFLFNTTVGENIRYGRPDVGDDEVRGALADLGLTGWVESLPHGLGTEAGPRGEALSAGERQLVGGAPPARAGPRQRRRHRAAPARGPAA
ncbi:ABC transporter ATP-binding protein, partial [Streptomyces sp. NPDC055886]